MNELATLDISGPVARLVLDRPEQRNALSVELLDALHERVDELARAPDVTVAVLEGSGKSFCAGMDLKQVIIDEAGDPELPRRLLERLARLTVKVRALECVTVARVHGAAIGGGCGLTCVCDLSLTHADARLGFPEVDLGLCPAVVAPWVMAKLGAARARRVLLLGGVMTGAEAHGIGLVDHCVDTLDGLDEAVSTLVRRLESGSRTALVATKGLLNRLDESAEASRVLEGAALSARVLATPEAQAALRARRKERGPEPRDRTA